MNDLKFKKLEQLVDKVYFNNKPYLSKFLDESEISYLSKFNKVNILFDGGFDNCKRARAFICPIDYDIAPNFNLNVFKVDYNKKFTTIEHKHVLGTIMALQVARDMIGDIFIDDNEVYFSSAKEIKEFLLLNLTVINRASINLIEVNDNLVIKENFEEKEFTVSSLRIDLIVSEVYNLSRNKVNEFFDKEFVLQNNLSVLKSFKQVNLNDIITCRTKGKFKIVNISNSARNNKFRITVNIYK